ncbi:MAG: hypothetical protein NC489_29140 [Ruminococcus flavefaciens]|nr:hypothetical protein [Ruminococcus flavefaciens]
MLDKNGIEIKTGDVVEIKGAYFKNDNGFYYVEHSAGDPGWSGSDHSLRKISKTGKISKAKRNICFWPIGVFTNSFETRITAKAWNAEHATIEVRTDINRKEIAEHFKAEAESMNEQIEYYSWNFGETSETTAESKRIQAHFEKVANMILAEA